MATTRLELPVHGMSGPILAGAAMALSSVSVVSNSLRLRRFRVPRVDAWSPRLEGT